jgi:hypothetical protein
MIVESQPTHSNLDGSISAKFHTRIGSSLLRQRSYKEDQLVRGPSMSSQMDDMIRQILFIFQTERSRRAEALAYLAVLRRILRQC